MTSYIPFNPYTLPTTMDNHSVDVQIRLGTLERICFEILAKVSQFTVAPVTSYGSGNVSKPQVLESSSGDISAPTQGVERKPLGNRKAVRIVDPSEPRMKPESESLFEDDMSTSSEESRPDARKCKKCSKTNTTKWDNCNKCYKKEMQLKNSILCSTSGCKSRVSRQNKSGLCHVCWTNAHPQCAFCEKRIRDSEESSSVCSTCHAEHKRWYKFWSPREAWQRTRQNGVIGKLYSRPTNGKFVAEIDQDEAVNLWEEHIDYLRVVSDDAHKARNAASARRTANAELRRKSAESALEKFTTGLTVEILPSRDEAEEESFLSKSALKDYKSDSELLTAPAITSNGLSSNVTFVTAARAATSQLPGFCKIPAAEASHQTKTISNVIEVYNQFPVSDGKHHSLGQLSPSLPMNVLPSLLPPTEKFEKTPSAAIPIVAPKAVVPFTSGNPDIRDKSKVCVPGSLLPGFSMIGANLTSTTSFGSTDVRLAPVSEKKPFLVLTKPLSLLPIESDTFHDSLGDGWVSTSPSPELCRREPMARSIEECGADKAAQLDNAYFGLWKDMTLKEREDYHQNTCPEYSKAEITKKLGSLFVTVFDRIKAARAVSKQQSSTESATKQEPDV